MFDPTGLPLVGTKDGDAHPKVLELRKQVMP